MQQPQLDFEYLPILKKAREQKHRYNPSDDLLKIALRKPRSIVGFVIRALHEPPGLNPFWTCVLDWMPEEDWPSVIRAAVMALTKGQNSSKSGQEFDFEAPEFLNLAENLETADYDTVFDVYSQIAGTSGKNMVAESVVSTAANQFPKLLHPHLKALYAYNRESQNFFGITPFRQTGAAEHDFLWDVIYNENASASEQFEAFQGLMFSGDPKVIRRTIELEDKIDFDAAYQAAFRGWNLPSLAREKYLDNELRRVGYALEQNQLRRLYNPDIWHVRLSTDSYREPAHPTWNTKLATRTLKSSSGEKLNKVCNLCGAALTRLLTIPAELNDATATFQYPPFLDVCLSCANFEHVYIQFDSHNSVQVLSTSPDEKMQYDVRDFFQTPFPIVLSQMPARWYFQDWGSAHGANLYRLGGEPSWVQGADYPECPCCERKMYFMLQHEMRYPEPIDERTSTHSDGMTYYFWCDKCRVYVSRSQYT